MGQTTEFSGGCLCGAVQYEIRGQLRPLIYCHCDQCRRTSGNFVAATACAPDELVIISEAGLRWYASSPHADRGYCRDCGSSLFWRPGNGEHISIMAGTINKPVELNATAHIFVGSASDFLTIADGLPQYEQGLPTEKAAAGK